MYSFIDFGLEDFLRDDKGDVIKISGTYEDAESWLLDNGEENGWTNAGVRYWNWDEES